MKKFLIVLGLALGLGGTLFAAVTTNRLGQVVTTDANGVVTSITNPNFPGSNTNTIIGLIGAQLIPGPNSAASAAAALTAATPRSIGDLLIYTEAGSNRLWFANSLTNWVDLD